MKNYLKNCKTIKPKSQKAKKDDDSWEGTDGQTPRPKKLKYGKSMEIYRKADIFQLTQITFSYKNAIKENHKRTIETSINSYVLKSLGVSPSNPQRPLTGKLGLGHTENVEY